MTCQTWGQRPSKILELNEDAFTEYCFDEAIAYAKHLYEVSAQEDKSNNSTSDIQKEKGLKGKGKTQNALSFMTQDRFKG